MNAKVTSQIPEDVQLMLDNLKQKSQELDYKALASTVRADEAIAEINQVTASMNAPRGKRLEALIQSLTAPKDAILTSPNGSKFKLVVDDAGTLSTVPIVE